MHLLHRLATGSSRIAIAGTLVISMLMPRVGFAQPAPKDKEADKAADKDKDKTPAAGEDEALYSCKKRSGQVAVTFKPETELKDLITWVMGFTCKNFVLDPRIVSTGKKVTVIAPNKMSAIEAYRVFLVALSTMGLTVVPKGNLMRIVESATAKGETVPLHTKGVPEDEDQIVRYVLRPTYAPVEVIRGALDSIRSPSGTVAAVGSMVLITDYASQVRDMMSLAHALDVPGNNDGIYTIPVQHADATQLQQKLNEILGLSAGAGAAAAGQANKPAGRNQPPAAGGATPPSNNSEDVSSAIPSKILVDERTNTLIVVSSEPAYERVKALVKRLDILLDTEGGSAVHVYPLDNALAEELATTLNNAMQGQNQAKPGAKPGAGGAPAAAAPPPIGGGGENFGAALEGTVRVIGDKSTNSLIVMSTGRDYLALKEVIRRLDQPRRQIFLEAMILEVQISKETDIGTSSHGGLPVDNSNALVIGGVQTPDLKSLSLSSLVSANGLIGGLIGAPLANSQTFLGTSIPSYGLLFQALSSQANTDILSAPHIIAINNEKAEFSVGNNIPYQAGLSFGGIGVPAAGATGATAPVGSIGQNIQREALNLTLNVTPHISSDDIVRLEIEQTDKDIGDKDPQLGPTWTERKLKTQVIIHDQQSVVIGGLIQEREIYNVTKVPLLGDIPLLGYLFKYQTRTKKKTNLLILLTPYIIKDQLDMQAIRERKVRERNEFVESFSSLDAMKYEPKVDYRRKRGMVEEINRAVLSVEQDLEAAGQLGHKVIVKEGPVEYGASQIDLPEPGHGDGTTKDPNDKPTPPPKRGH